MDTVLKRSALFVAIIGMTVMGISQSQAASTRALSEKNINQTVSVRVGGTVSLTLHSMYWTLNAQAKSSSLLSKGAPILKPVLPGPTAPNGCKIAGSGCGTQTWKFKATKIGTAHLLATRTTCGEAMRCTGSTGRFEVTIKIIR